jgi:GntR family transcriptional regulator, transcriptional repressor for pyruvate dehydrogenase complex
MYGGITTFMSMIFDEVKNLTRSRQIVDKFRKALAEGMLRVGDKLPPERELCQQFGVSRTSLREAVRSLEAYGLVESQHGGGSYITDRFSENVFDFLGFGNILDRKNFKPLLHTRRVIETGAVEQALETSDAAAIQNLEALVEDLARETDPLRLGALDARFHEKFVELSGNPILTALYRMIFKILIQGTSQVITYPTARDVAVFDHRMIFEAL